MPSPRPLTVRIAEAVYAYDRALRSWRISDRKRQTRKGRALRRLSGVLRGRDLGALRDALRAEISDAQANTIAACTLRLASDRADHQARYDALVTLMRVLPDAEKAARAGSVPPPPDGPPSWAGRADIGG